MIADRQLTLADIIEYNKVLPFEKRKALLYGERQTFQVRTLADELPSILIGGLPNFGKTSCMAFLCCQIVMCQGKLVVIDPHANAPRDSLAKIVAPLSEWFALPLIDFEDTHQIVGAFRFVEQEYMRRNRKNASNFYPLFLIVDEWNILLDMLDTDEYEAVIRCVRTVARAARKFGIWICLAAQNWNLDSSGGPEVRKSITGRISFTQELSDMRMTLATKDTRTLSDLTATPLGKGQAIFKHPSFGMKRVWYPPMDRNECEIVARNMHSCLGLVHQYPQKPTENDVCDSHQYLKTPTPSLQPVKSDIPTCDPTTNVTPSATNPHEYTTNKGKKIQITDQERTQIETAAKMQMQQTGGVNRTQLMKDLGWQNKNNAYDKIKVIADLHGWHLPSKQDKLPAEIWEEIKTKHNHRCIKYGCYTENLEPDRIIPAVKGGAYTPENVQPLCKACNSGKGAKVVDYREDEQRHKDQVQEL